MSIQLDDSEQEVLRTLQAQADARNMRLAEYLRLFAAAGDVAPVADQVSLVEFDFLLDQLAEGTPAALSLPTDFSRADIYADHD